MCAHRPYIYGFACGPGRQNRQETSPRISARMHVSRHVHVHTNATDSGARCRCTCLRCVGQLPTQRTHTLYKTSSDSLPKKKTKIRTCSGTRQLDATSYLLRIRVICRSRSCSSDDGTDSGGFHGQSSAVT